MQVLVLLWWWLVVLLLTSLASAAYYCVLLGCSAPATRDRFLAIAVSDTKVVPRMRSSSTVTVRVISRSSRAAAPPPS